MFISFRSQASSPSHSHFRSFRHKKYDEHLKSRKSKKKARSRYDESVYNIRIDPEHHQLLHSKTYFICWVFFFDEQLHAAFCRSLFIVVQWSWHNEVCRRETRICYDKYTLFHPHWTVVLLPAAVGNMHPTMIFLHHPVYVSCWEFH